MKRRNFSRIQRLEEHGRGKFINPYFQHRNIRRTKRLRLLVAAFFVLTLAAPVAVVASPLYRIKTITVAGLTTIPEQDVTAFVEAMLEKKRIGVFSQRNRIFLPVEVLKNELQQTYQFSQLAVDVNRTAIHVFVEEKISEVVWVTGDQMYFLDLDGTIVRELYTQERQQIDQRLGRELVDPLEETGAVLAPTMPIIFDDSNTSVIVGTNPIQPITVSHVIDFDKGIRKLIIHPKTYGLPSQGTSWMRIDTDMAYDILFDATLDTEAQWEVLRSVLQGQEGLLAEEYIDIRFGNRVFVK